MQGIRFVKLMHMKLTIHNFAKIESAELLLDGMTVICGDNNTGKSTVVKILTTLLESLRDLNRKIANARREKYKALLSNLTDNPSSGKSSRPAPEVLKKLLDSSLSVEELNDIVRMAEWWRAPRAVS